MGQPERTRWVAQLLSWEAAERGRRNLNQRLRAAHIGRFKSLADFDWSWPKSIDRGAVEELMTPEFLREANNVVLVGPNGVGKTMCACNLGYHAVLALHTALFITAGNLLGELAALDSDSALRRKLRQFAAPDLLVIDEVGYLSYSNRHAEPFTPGSVAPPSHDDRHRVGVERIKSAARTAGVALDHSRVRKALDELDDRSYPCRRPIRAKRDQELNQRLGAILAAAGPNASSKGDGAYLRVALAWLTTERRAGREPDRVAWREFDLQQGANALAQAYIPVQAVAALTRLSPGAVRNLEVLEAKGAHATAGEVVDIGYALAVMSEVRAVKLVAEARAGLDGRRRRGPYEPR